jgi:hypothetical protein
MDLIRSDDEIVDLLESGASVELSAQIYALFLEGYAEIAARSGGILSVRETDLLDLRMMKQILAKGGRKVVTRWATSLSTTFLQLLHRRGD